MKVYDGNQLAHNLYWDVKTMLDENMAADSIIKIITLRMKQICVYNNSEYSKVRFE